MNSDEKHDVRLVYLACAWLVAHRGHFLSEISKDNISALTDFTAVYDELICYFTDNEYAVPWSSARKDEIKDILRKKLSVSAKYSALCSVLFGGKKSPKGA